MKIVSVSLGGNPDLGSVFPRVGLVVEDLMKIDPEIEALLAECPVSTDEDWEALKKASRQLASDPDYIRECKEMDRELDEQKKKRLNTMRGEG